MIVVDFGTATTFDVVTPQGEYLGGVICPGHRHLAPRRSSPHASRLYRGGHPPARASWSGATPPRAMQSGLYFGYVGLVDGILARLAGRAARTASVVATGGLAELIAGARSASREVDPQLTLIGLKLIYERNR